jgi:hypothetical protein
MKRHHAKLAMALLFVTVLSIGAISEAWAQEGNLAKQIQGSWTLVSCVNEQDGKKADVFGPNPRGFMVLTPEGRFSMIMMRASLPKFASDNRMKGTAKENESVVKGSQATFGTYKVVNDKEGKLIFHFEGCTFPNWDGQDLPRTMTVNGDEIKQINPTAAVGGTNYLIWRRVK